MNTDALFQAMKEVVRLAVFAAVSAFVASLLSSFDGSTEPVFVVLTLVLRFVDKWIHENENTNWKGLLPF